MEYTSKVEHTAKSMDRLACSVYIHPTFANLIFITPSGATLDGGGPWFTFLGAKLDSFQAN